MVSRYSRVTSFVLLISCLQPHHLKANEQLVQRLEAHNVFQPSIYAKVASELLVASQEHITVSEDSAFEDDKDDQLTEGQKRTVVFKLFAENSLANYQSKLSVSTDDIRKDLEFFNQSSLFSHLKRTKTVFGDVVLARRIAEPTADIEELKRRQAIVRRLVEDEKLFELFDKALTEIKKAEPVILSFFSAQNELRQQLLSPLYFDKTIWSGFPGYSDDWDKDEKTLFVTEVLQKGLISFSLLSFYSRTKLSLEVINKKVLLSGWGIVFLLRRPDIFQKIAGPALLVGVWFAYKNWRKKNSGDQPTSLAALLRASYPNLPAGAAAAQQNHATSGATDNAQGIQLPTSNAKSDLSQVNVSTVPPVSTQPLDLNQLTGVNYLWNQFLAGLYRGWQRTKAGIDKFTEAQRKLSSFEMAALLPLTLYTEIKAIYMWQKKIGYLQKRLMHLGGSVRKMRSISASLLRHKELVSMMPEVRPLMHLFERGNGSQDMQKLLAMLESPTFKGKPSARSNFGRIAATNKLMDSTKYDWVEVFEAIGYLDVYLSTAKLMKELSGNKASYCFAEYVASDKPHLELGGFWDPLLNPDHAVPNSLSLGDPTRNIILTGPNTGGKSTVIKGIMLTTLCAQTLAIAPAQSCKITPFSSFNTYINIADNVEKGLSLFAAEVARANVLKNKIIALPQNQFGLTIIDEMFRGTAPDQAEQLSYRYADNIGNYINSICLVATHYPKLIDLEQDTHGKYHNYKVEIEKLPDGTLKRNYKLLRGSTTQNVAVDILKEQGLI